MKTSTASLAEPTAAAGLTFGEVPARPVRGGGLAVTERRTAWLARWSGA